MPSTAHHLPRAALVRSVPLRFTLLHGCGYCSVQAAWVRVLLVGPCQRCLLSLFGVASAGLVHSCMPRPLAEMSVPLSWQRVTHAWPGMVPSVPRLAALRRPAITKCTATQFRNARCICTHTCAWPHGPSAASWLTRRPLPSPTLFVTAPAVLVCMMDIAKRHLGDGQLQHTTTQQTKENVLHQETCTMSSGGVHA